MSEPFIVGLLFADRVISEDNGKKGIIGTFTTLNSNRYPVVFAPWYVYTAVTNIEPGEQHTHSINITHPDTNHVLLSATGKFQVDDYNAVPEIVLPIANVVFAEAGKYLVDVSIDGRSVGNRFLIVANPDAEK